MNTDLAIQRDRLVQRSQLARIQLRREAQMVRESLRWTNAAASVASTPLARRALLGVALSIFGANRAPRLIKFAGFAVLAIQVGRALAGAYSRR